MIVRLIEERDIAQALAIQTGLPQIAQWTAADYDLSGRAGMIGWVADDGQRAAGFLVARHIADEFEILNLAVNVFERRRGAGTLLLSAALHWAVAQGATNAYLEVRESNSVAIQFYKHHRFEIRGRRPRYYASPTEDALVLAATLEKS